MEFGNPPAPKGSPTIDEATRLAASTRVNMIMPSHNNVIADDLSDSQIVTQHLVQPAVANAANDTESTTGDSASNIAPQKIHIVALTASISVSLALTALLAYVFVTLT